MSYPIMTRITSTHPMKLFDMLDKTSIRLQMACIEKDELMAENERLRAWGREAYIWLELCCPMADAYQNAPDSVKVARWLGVSNE